MKVPNSLGGENMKAQKFEESRRWDILQEEEKEKTLSILKTLEGMSIERAWWLLDGCKELLKQSEIPSIE